MADDLYCLCHLKLRCFINLQIAQKRLQLHWRLPLSQCTQTVFKARFRIPLLESYNCTFQIVFLLKKLSKLIWTSIILISIATFTQARLIQGQNYLIPILDIPVLVSLDWFQFKIHFVSQETDLISLLFLEMCFWTGKSHSIYFSPCCNSWKSGAAEASKIVPTTLF